jgi:hypothetical protein
VKATANAVLLAQFIERAQQVLSLRAKKTAMVLAPANADSSPDSKLKQMEWVFGPFE